MGRLHIFLLAAVLLVSDISASSVIQLTLDVRQELPSSRPGPSTTLSPGSTSLKQTTTLDLASKPDITTTAGVTLSQHSRISSRSTDRSPSLGASARVSSVTISSSATTTTSPPSATDGFNDEPELPLRPIVSPAIGTAGVILMLSGAAYAFIGIRTNQLYVFISSAYLVALAIVVLIVYLVHPPVTWAIQGAFLIAVIIPACVIGGISLIFKDLADCLTTFLGGFCLGMWFLVLKDGGLIASTGGRIGIIAGFSVAGLSLSFSQYTRAYGLIASTSFAGATAIALGIDCFSRAGLKEFWLYIWNLNSEIFPHHTNTYPVTKGIKAEIATIIIIAVFGSVSQMKLWKTLKDLRKKKAGARSQDNEEKDNLEAQQGREVEEKVVQERAQWEAIYGDKTAGTSVSAVTGTESSLNSIHDSGYRSQPVSINKASVGAAARGANDVELEKLNATSVRSQRAAKGSSGVASSLHPSSPRTVSFVAGDGSEKSRLGISDAPPVPPLPVEKVETIHGEDNDDAKSLATAGDSVYEDEELQDGRANQSLHPRQMKTTTGPARASRGIDIARNKLNDPRIESSRTSIAATIDGLSEAGDRDLPSPPHSVSPMSPVDDPTKPSLSRHKPTRTRSASSLDRGVAEHPFTVDSAIRNVNRRCSLRLSGAHPDYTLGSSHGLPSSIDDELVANAPAEKKRSSGGSETGLSSFNSILQPVPLTNAALPDSQSHVALMYRTDEWAKHAVTAEPLADAPIPDGSEINAAVEYEQEPVARVDVQQLQQTAFPGQADSMTRKSSSTSIKGPSPKPQSLRRITSSPPVPVYGHSPLVRPQQPPQTGPRVDDNNLMGRREDMLRERISTTSFAKLNNAAHPNHSLTSISERPNRRSYTVNDDNIPLSKHRQQLQHHQSLTRSPHPQPQQSRRHSTTSQPSTVVRTPSSTFSLSRQSQTHTYRGQSSPHLSQQPHPLTRSSSYNPSNYRPSPNTMTRTTTFSPSNTPNTHQPRRGATTTSAPRESQFAGWRASIGADADADRMRREQDRAILASVGSDSGVRRSQGFEEAHRKQLRRLQSLAE